MSLTKEPELLVEEQVLLADRAAALFPQPQVINTLIQRGVLTPERDGGFRVRFVGVAVAGERSFQVLPKVFHADRSNSEAIMRQVVRALRRYARWRPEYHEETPYLDPNAHRVDLNALAIADWLIRDYLSNGIYRRLRDREEINGPGQISWHRTIEKMMPVMSSGRPAYLDTITRSTAGDHDHFVSRLHRQLVEISLQRFGHLLGYARFPLDHEPFEPFIGMPALSLSRTRILQEMREAYSDRAMQLLPMLLAWLSATQMATKAGLALYGVTTFHPVWEEACALALGNERDIWQPLIPRPTWRSVNGYTQSAETFRPDIVTRLKDKEGEYLLIADAKYYRLNMPPALDGQPGINDVAKQLWYEQSLATAARVRGLTRIYNIFVLPGSEREIGFWSDGEVELQGMTSTTVKVKRLSALQAFQRYADGSPLSPEYVNVVVTEI